jgi:hypothetical protein
MDTVTLDDTRRSAVISAGLERAAGFTWEESARRTAAFFRQVLT